MAASSVPICRVAGHRFAGTHVALGFGSSQWFARNRKVLLADHGSTDRVIWEAADAIAELIPAGDRLWAFAVSGQFAVFAQSGTVVATGSLKRRFTSGAALPEEGVAICVDGFEIVRLRLSTPVAHECCAEATSIFQIDDTVITLHAINTSRGPVVVTVAESGAVYAWSLPEDRDVSTAFGGLRIPVGRETVSSSALVGTALWVGTSSGAVWATDFTGKVESLSTQHDAAICGVVQVPESNFVWTASVDGCVVVWSLDSKIAIGSFQIAGSGLRTMQLGRTHVESTVGFLQADGNLATWEVSAPVAEPGPALNTFALMEEYRAALTQAVEVLAGSLPEAKFTPAVVESIPEIVYVGEALKSLSECSSEINRGLHALSLTPSSLVRDTSLLANAAITAAEMERRARQSGFGSSAAFDNEWRGISAAIDTALTTNELRCERDAALADSRRLQHQCDQLTAQLGSIEAELDRVRAHRHSEPSHDMAKLREELDAKNAFVVELLQIVKDNTSCIEDLRNKYRAKKQLLVAEQSRSRGVERKLQIAMDAIERHCATVPQLRNERIDELMQALDHLR